MKTDYQNTIILTIRSIREKNGCNQASLAKLLNISDGHMGNIESPKTSHKYTLAQISRICKHFNVPVSQVFGVKATETAAAIDELIDNIVKYTE